MNLYLSILLICLFAFASVAEARTVTVRVDPSQQSAWTISPELFGSFYEEHWGDVSPGVFEQYLVNASFEPWYVKEGENRSRALFPTPSYEGVAFPWEPIDKAATYSLSPDCSNSTQAQCIQVAGGAGGVLQKVALPDYRELRYRLRFYARAEGKVAVEAQIRDGAEVRDRKTIHPGAKWQPFTVELDAKRALTNRHLNHFGIAEIAIAVQGEGRLWIDQATLFPVDAVAGVYNPETLAHIAEFRPTLIRWPGGNYSSGYHWRDGIGDPDKRPTRRNRAWGGLVDDLVGTDEWLRFCARAKLEPVIGCGFSEEIPPQELADWVQYCNGDASTPMGRLRADTGHPKPYGVKYWGIGNEVYGSYQIGHTDATTYARGFVERARAMKAADPTIKVIAVGYGLHNTYRRPENRWNRTVLEIAGPSIDLLDAHHYVYGPERDVIDRDGPETATRAFLASDQWLIGCYQQMRKLLESRPETRHIKLAHDEWGVLPHAAVPARQSFANALAVACHYHAYFRNGDLVKQTGLHNFSYYTNTGLGHSEPPNPRSSISKMYAWFAGMHVVRTVSDSPTYSLTTNYPEIGPLKDIPEVDVIALSKGAGRLHICLVNRSLTESFDIIIHVAGRARPARRRIYQSDEPLKRNVWGMTEPPFRVSDTKIKGAPGGDMRVTLPKAAVAHLEMELQ